MLVAESDQLQGEYYLTLSPPQATVMSLLHYTPKKYILGGTVMRIIKLNLFPVPVRYR